MRLADYLQVLRGGWGLLLGGALLGALLGLALAALQPKDYSSTTAVYVTMADGTDPSSVFQMGEYMRSQLVTYAELAERPIVLEPAAEELDADLSAEQLEEMTSIDLPSESYLLEIEVDSEDPQLSADTSEAVAESLVSQVEVIAPEYEDQAVVELSIVDRPVSADSPDSLPWVLLAGAGALVGLVLGLLLAFLRFSLRAQRPSDGS